MLVFIFINLHWTDKNWIRYATYSIFQMQYEINYQLSQYNLFSDQLLYVIWNNNAENP